MKTSINGWTLEGTLDFKGAFEAAKSAGFDGIELNVDKSGAHSLTVATTDDELARIRALAEQCELPVVSVSTSLWGASMGVKSEWDFAMQVLRTQLRCAKKLGAKGILTVPGGMGSITLDAARRSCIEFLKSAKSEIEDSGIFVGVENVWNGFFLSPYDMASFIDEINSPLVGAYLDVGNMIAFSVPEYWVEVLGSRIGFVHVKDFKRNGYLNSGGSFVDVTEGSADWSKIIPALRAAGFDGYLTGEVFKSSDISYADYYKKVSEQIASVCKL